MGCERRAVVLFSGGLDSTTVLAMAKAAGYAPYALTVDYGQRHLGEVAAATRLARAMGVHGHHVLPVGLSAWGGSSLVGDGEVGKGRRQIGADGEVPRTYVPARNTVLLACALAWAEALGAFDLFFGANRIDYSGYPDCREPFVAAFARLANLATRAGADGSGRFRVHVPLMRLDKAAIIRRGIELGVDYAATTSCYDPIGEAACGLCDACLLRRRGFGGANLSDPTAYAAGRAPPPWPAPWPPVTLPDACEPSPSAAPC